MDCLDGAVPGVCQPTGFCAFPDPECPSGLKYEDGAGNGLGGQCVDANESADAATFSSFDGTGTATTDSTTAGPGGGPVCGNGVPEAGEECDDGNPNNADACTNACRLPTCSDGIINQGETDFDCGGAVCGPCALCSTCAQPADCQSGDCGSGGFCTVAHQIEIDWVTDCSESGEHVVELDDLPAGDYMAFSVPSAATKWAITDPPASGWIYTINCFGLDFEVLGTQPGIAYATPGEAYANLLATEEFFFWGGGPLFCGLADPNCSDNQGSIVFEIELSCQGIID